MEKRLTFRCWNCKRKYSLYKEITNQQELIVACPFCNKEAVVKLEPHRKEKHSVLKGNAGSDQALGYEYQFPDVIPTQPR
jgi:DNA-directed RNA polymerase subunit RPC12/RpoP